jgi:hypothetical protein
VKVSQRLQVQRHLAKGLSITPLQALEKFGCLTLSQRIGEIKRDGFKVQSTMIEVGGKRVASYTMAKL